MAKYISILVFLCTSAVATEASDRMSGSEGRAHSQCHRKCQAEAKRLFRECRANGGSEQQCQIAARERFARCVENHCTQAPPCEQRCQIEAAHLFRGCVESGEDEATCATRSRHALVECLTEHCAVPADCGERCEYLGRHLARLCVAQGGAQDVCTARAREFVQQCVNENCPTCGGILGTVCPKGQVCIFPAGECNVADNIGECRPLGGACPMIYQPVCGCDGETYGNACEAHSQGVSIDHPGPCDEVCGGILGVPCPEGQFCQFPPGECLIADNQGRCRPVPSACPDVYDPVCGCDGKTYGNACEAAMAGAQIDHAGTCAE